MKGISLIALVVALSAAPAMAGGLDDAHQKRRTPMDLPPPREERVEPNHFVLSGFYLGVEAGGQITSIKPDVPGMPENLGLAVDGLVAGVFGGYDVSNGPVKFGLCAAGGISNVGTDLGGSTEGGMDYYAQICGRAGFVTNGGTFIYGKVGYEYQAWSGEGGLDGDLDTYWWVLGAGVETPIDTHVKFRIGYDYLSFADGDGDLTSNQLEVIAGNTDAHRIMGGIVYTFGGN